METREKWLILLKTKLNVLKYRKEVAEIVQQDLDKHLSV